MILRFGVRIRQSLALWAAWLSLLAAPVTASAQARLERVDGARVLYLRGAPYARGYEYGRLLADDIRYCFNRYLRQGLVERWGVPWEHLAAAAARMEPHIPAELRQEMRGIAAGCGLDYRDLLILNTHVDAAQYAADVAMRTPQPGGCSGIAVMGRWTSDGRVLHGHNVDWTTQEQAQRAALLLVIAPEEGVPFCMPTHAGLVGCNAGMNAAGITYSDMTSFSSDQTLDAVPLMTMGRLLLQQSRSLGQALAYLRRAGATCGWNMIITDANLPDLRAIEISATHLKVFRPGDPAENTPTGAATDQAVIRTNHFVDQQMFALACKRFAVPPEVGVALSRADSTYLRYCALRERLRAQRLPVEPRDIMRWLAQPPVGGGDNLQSMVFDPRNSRLWLANAGDDGAPACAMRYACISLKRYFGPWAAASSGGEHDTEGENPRRAQPPAG